MTTFEIIKSALRAKASQHANASRTDGSDMPATFIAEAPRKRTCSSLHIALKDRKFKFLITAPSTMILAKPEGGGVQCET
jgi:hypothetical protein